MMECIDETEFAVMIGDGVLMVAQGDCVDFLWRILRSGSIIGNQTFHRGYTTVHASPHVFPVCVTLS